MDHVDPDRGIDLSVVCRVESPGMGQGDRPAGVGDRPDLAVERDVQCRCSRAAGRRRSFAAGCRRLEGFIHIADLRPADLCRLAGDPHVAEAADIARLGTGAYGRKMAAGLPVRFCALSGF